MKRRAFLLSAAASVLACGRDNTLGVLFSPDQPQSLQKASSVLDGLVGAYQDRDHSRLICLLAPEFQYVDMTGGLGFENMTIGRQTFLDMVTQLFDGLEKAGEKLALELGAVPYPASRGSDGSLYHDVETRFWIPGRLNQARYRSQFQTRSDGGTWKLVEWRLNEAQN